jgi:hypothetical protein
VLLPWDVLFVPADAVVLLFDGGGDEEREDCFDGLTSSCCARISSVLAPADQAGMGGGAGWI